MINLLLPERAATKQILGNPGSGVIGWMDRGSNTSGVFVNEDIALNFSAVWAATRVISETLATLPCIMYRRRPDGSKERAIDDDRFTLVHDEPNDEMTAFEFFETGTQHLVNWGNSYSKVVRLQNNFPIELLLKTPDRVTMSRNADGLIEYDVKSDRGSETIDAPDMLHVRGMGHDGHVGYSVIRKHAQTIGIGMAAEQYAGASFGNGAMPAGLLTHPAKLDIKARENIRRDWNETHQTAAKSNKIAIMHGGMTWQQMGMTNEDAQLLLSRKFSVEEIGRIYRIPLHMLGLLDKATFSNIEAQGIDFVVYSLAAWISRWEAWLKRRLLRPPERTTMYFEFLVDALLRGDLKSRYESYAVARQWGWLSVNDILRLENMNPIGPNGDRFLEPLNMVPAGEGMQEVMQAIGDIGDQVKAMPQTLKDESWNNLQASINQVISSAKEMQTNMQTATGEDVESLVAGVMSQQSANLDAHLSTLREDRKLIQADIEREAEDVRQAIVQGVDTINGRVDASAEAIQGRLSEVETNVGQRISDSVSGICGHVDESVSQQVDNIERLRGAANEMLAACLGQLLQIEGTQANKAAGRQAERGESFMSWMDTFYGKHTERVRESLTRPLRALSRLDGSDAVADKVTGRHVQRSRDELLACADGDRDGFADRVKACTESWTISRISEDLEIYDELLRTDGGSSRSDVGDST